MGSVTVSSGSANVIADGASYTQIFVTVKDNSGASVPDGTAVAFTTTAGTLSLVTTTSEGVSTARLTSSTNRGAATVIATSGGVSGNVVVNFVAGPPEKVSVSANPGNLTADGTSTSTITITVLDENDNPVTDGSTLTLSADCGTPSADCGALSNLTATTTDGKATVTYTAPNSVPTGSQATVTVTTNSKTGTATGTATITLIGPQIATINLSANPTSLPADGASTATITATLTVSGGGSPPDGTTVNFSTTPESDRITKSATTAGGVASATLTSAASPGTDTIQAIAGGRTAQIDVDYTPGSVTVTIVPNSILGTGDKVSDVTALLKNASGEPLSGETVTFSLSDESLGTVTPAIEKTSAETGEALVKFHADTKGATGTITASWTTGVVPDEVVVTGSADVVVQPPPSFMQVASGYPDPTAISIRGTGGQSTSQIVFDVKDASGNLVVDGYRVDFSILSGPNGGEEISPLFATTTNGKVSTILRGGYKSGPVSIKATYHHDTNVSTVTSQITIVAGPPVGEEMGISAQYLNISGLYLMGLENTITVSAGDIYGNAIPDYTAISFKTYNTGGIYSSPGSSTTMGGTATNKLESSSSPSPMQGFVSITGEAVNGGRTTHITSMAVSPTSTDIIYAGTDGGGAYKSIDSGVTWANISRSSTTPGQNWIDPYVNDMAVDPDNENIIYAATGYLGEGHLYRSLDGGANWTSNHTEEYNGVFSANSAVLAVLCDDTLNDYVWLGTDGAGAYLSTDGDRNSFQVGGVVTPIAPTVEAAGIFNNPADTGTGTMTEPTLSINSKTEDWTLTYNLFAASATNPQAAAGNTGNGTMTTVTTDNTTTKSENWAVKYTSSIGTVTGPSSPKGSLRGISSRMPNGPSETWTLKAITINTPIIGLVTGSATAKGSATGISIEEATENETFTLTCTTAATAPVIGTVTGTPTGKGGDVEGIAVTHTGTETFTLECTDDTIPGSEVFSVTSSLGTPSYLPATVDVAYNQNDVQFKITPVKTGVIGAVTGTATGKGGDVEGIAVTHTGTETFTLECTDDTIPGSEVFSVTSSLGTPSYLPATVDVAYNQNDVQFKITPVKTGVIGAVTGTATGKGGDVEGIAVTHTGTETFTLECTDDTIPGSEVFSVTSSLGTPSYLPATVDVAYNQNDVQFKITPADAEVIPYVMPDTADVFTYG